MVVRGQKMDVTYPLYSGKNYLGRTDDKPVDIDLEDQESADRIWTRRQHAVVTFENGKLTVEDLNSLNGTFVNRTRVHPGQVRESERERRGPGGDRSPEGRVRVVGWTRLGTLPSAGGWA